MKIVVAVIFVIAWLLNWSGGYYAGKQKQAGTTGRNSHVTFYLTASIAFLVLGISLLMQIPLND